MDFLVALLLLICNLLPMWLGNIQCNMYAFNMLEVCDSDRGPTTPESQLIQSQLCVLVGVENVQELCQKCKSKK